MWRPIPSSSATNFAAIFWPWVKWQHKFQPGQRYVIQANLQLPDRPDCPGYSFPWVGGEATHVVIPNEVMEQDCLLAYDGENLF